MPAIQNSYTSTEQIAALTGRDLSTRTDEALLNAGLYSAAAQTAAAEIDRVIGNDYVLPISDEASPISYRALAAINAIGAAYFAFTTLNAHSNDPGETNPWMEQWTDALDRLTEDHALPDAPEMADMLGTSAQSQASLGALLQALVNQAIADLEIGPGNLKLPPGHIIRPGDVLEAGAMAGFFGSTDPSGFGGGFTETQARALFGELVEPAALRANPDHPWLLRKLPENIATTDDLLDDDDVRGLIRLLFGVTTTGLPDRVGTNGYVWTWRNGSINWEAPTGGGGGGGLTSSQVDARINALTQLFARTAIGNAAAGRLTRLTSLGTLEGVDLASLIKTNEVRYADASPSDLQRYDGTTWINIPGGGGGLTQAQVDARVRAIGGRLRFSGTALPAVASYSDGDLALIPHDGFYRVVEANVARNSLDPVAWTPTRMGSTMLYGFDQRRGIAAGQRYGSRPTGWPTTIQSLFTDSANNIWLYTTPGTFSRNTNAAIELTIDGLTLTLPFNRTANGVDHYALGPLSRRQWSDQPIQIGIHALGALTPLPFTAATKDWHKVESTVPYQLPDNLKLLNQNVVDGGWGPQTNLNHTAPRSAPYTEANAKAAAYSATTQHGSRLETQHLAFRVPKTIIDTQPSASELARFRITTGDDPEDLVIDVSGATYLGDDNTYWYYNLAVPDIPAGSRLQVEWLSPTELEHIEIPVGDIDGLDARITQIAGAAGPQENDVRYDDTSPSDLERYDGTTWDDIPAPAIPDPYTLPENLAALDRRIMEGGWDTRATEILVSAPNETARDAAAAIALSATDPIGYAAVQGPVTPRRQNWYVVIRITDALLGTVDGDLERFRLSINTGGDWNPASDTNETLKGVARLAQSGGFSYYQIQVPDIPAADSLRGEFDEPIEIDDTQVSELPKSFPAADNGKFLGWDDGALANLSPPQTAGVITVHEGAINSPNLSGGLNANHLGGHTKFSPDFNLDTHANGFFEYELDITVGTAAISNPSGWQFSFAPDRIATTAHVTGLQALSAIAATEDYVAGGEHEGLVGSRQPLYAGATAGSLQKIGDFIFRTSHDADNDLYYDWDYEAAAGAPTVTGTAEFSSTLAAVAQKSDAAAADAGGGGMAGVQYTSLGSFSQLKEATADNSFSLSYTTPIITDEAFDATWQVMVDSVTRGYFTTYVFLYRGSDFRSLIVGASAVAPTPFERWIRQSRGNRGYNLLSFTGPGLIFATDGNQGNAAASAELRFTRSADNRITISFTNAALSESQRWEINNFRMYALVGGGGGGGGGGGSSTGAVDGRVRALVDDFAEEGNNTPIPRDKMTLGLPTAVPLVHSSSRANATATGATVSQAQFNVAVGNRIRVEATALLELAAGTQAANFEITVLLPTETTEDVVYTSSGQAAINSSQAEIRQLVLDAEKVVPAGKAGEATVKLKLMSANTGHSVIDRTLKCTVFK